MEVPMKTSDAGREDIEGYEGKRYKAYYDTGGVITNGVGHTGPDVYEGQVVDDNQIDQWLKDDLIEAEDAIHRLVKVSLTQGQFDALASFVFNLGEGQFHNSTLLRKLNAGDYEGAKGQFKRWVYDNGEIQPGLVKRRNGEVARWDNG
jgi:lysozyme